MRDDDQADSAHELFAEAMFGDHDLGRPILGTVDTIKAAKIGNIHRFYAKHYKPLESLQLEKFLVLTGQ